MNGGGDTGETGLWAKELMEAASAPSAAKTGVEQILWETRRGFIGRQCPAEAGEMRAEADETLAGERRADAGETLVERLFTEENRSVENRSEENRSDVNRSEEILSEEILS